MKKKLIIVLCLSVALLCTACKDKDVQKNESSNQGYQRVIDIDCTSDFSSIDEMAAHIISGKDDVFPLFFEHPTQSADPQNLTFYSLGNLPDGYELENVNQCGEKITLTYTNKTASEVQPINFIWKFTPIDGAVFLESYVMMNRLKEMPDMSGYYCGVSKDTNGNEICKIAWTEDNYFFELDGPSDLTENKDFKITLEKEAYQIG